MRERERKGESKVVHFHVFTACVCVCVCVCVFLFQLQPDIPGRELFRFVVLTLLFAATLISFVLSMFNDRRPLYSVDAMQVRESLCIAQCRVTLSVVGLLDCLNIKMLN